MNTIHKNLTFSVPLTALDLLKAEEFSQKQSEPCKKEQVFLNTLAVRAVNFYCQCLEIETDIQQGDSWNLVSQTLLNVADLTLKTGNKLESDRIERKQQKFNR